MKQKSTMFLTAGLSAGGAQKVTVTVANELAKHGSVSLVSIYPGGVNEAFISVDVEYLPAVKPRIRNGLWFLVQQLRRLKPHVLICNKDDVAVLGLVASYLARVDTRVIARVANKPVYYYQDDGLKKWLKYKLLQFLYTKSWRIISVSKSLKKELQQVYQLKSEHIEVIYNPPGIYNTHSNTIPEGRYPESLKIVSIGRLVSQKNHPLFIDILSEMTKNHNVEGFIIGVGELKEQLQEYVAEKLMSDRIHFVDYVDNPVHYLQAADVYLLTSHYEGLSGSLIHALISGVNIVSADCDHGSAEILSDGRFGSLVKGYNVQNYLEAIDEAVRNPRDNSGEEFETHLMKFEIAAITTHWQQVLRGA